ncbi:hypothetical protein [Azospirillum sp. ST 5-10]|uniref:hypothetical protein n=1 Tax=unclassified Azospirillum TaxID=2630922 RepID=UPI003F4A0653
MADQPSARSAAASGGATYTIFLRDFTSAVALSGRDGRHAARINIRLTVAHPGAGFPDDIAAVLSYEDIVLDLRALCADATVAGPADLAERTVRLCLAPARVQRACVTAEIAGAGSDEIVRERTPGP